MVQFLNILVWISLITPLCLGELPCAPVRTRSCPGITNRANLVGVYLDDCWDEPCLFRKGQTVTIEMDMEFKEPVHNMTARISGNIGGAEFPWPGGLRNICDFIVSEGSCPLKKGDYITYGDSMYIEPVYPSVNADVKFHLFDEEGRTQVCWMVKAHIRI